MKCVKQTWKQIFIMLTNAKHEHEKNMTRLWCKIVPRIGVEQTKGNKGSYSYLYPFEDLAQGSFYVCIK